MATNNQRYSGKKLLKRWKITTLSLFFIFTIVFAGCTALLSHLGFNPWEMYANIANPYMRFVTIPPGLRKEQIAEIYAKTLSWNDADKQQFMDTAGEYNEYNPEGVFLPGVYWVRTSAHGKEVAMQMIDAFYSKVNKEILAKKNTAFKQKVNIDTALRIASIIQREAAGPQDMNVISGVIWNRLFKGMSLDMDATLQYAKGTPKSWWPKVVSSDKYIDSPFNTYKNSGLPPTAISNPSLDALKAAFNPTPTSCIFYLHDNSRGIHCSATYAQHKANVNEYLVGSR